MPGGSLRQHLIEKLADARCASSIAVRWSGAPERSVLANAVLPKGARRSASRGAGFPSLPKKKPGCGLTYACPQRLRIMPAISRWGSDPEHENISVNCSRIRRSHSRNGVERSSARPKFPLFLQRQAGMRIKNFQREHYGRIGSDCFLVCRKGRNFPHRGEAAETLKPLAP